MLKERTEAGKAFGREESFILKGIAILMMLHHHNFLKGRFEEYPISFWPFHEVNVTNLAALMKICVSLFAFISGYGLYKSYMQESDRPVAWCLKRYVKTFSGFWFDWVLICIICQLIDGRFVTVFSEHNLWWDAVDVALDLLGLSYLWGRPTMIGTWWYMGAAVVFIAATPVLCMLKEQLPSVILLALLLPRVMYQTESLSENVYGGGVKPWPFLIVMMFGMLFARDDLFEKIRAAARRSRGRRLGLLVAGVLFLYGGYKLYNRIPAADFYEIKIVLISIVYIVFLVEYVVPIPYLREVLCFLGRHSANIFILHSFIRAIYLKDFIYGFRHFVLIDLALLTLSLGCSIAIEYLKKKSHYHDFIAFLLRRADRVHV